jgi:hypothetical protein
MGWTNGSQEEGGAGNSTVFDAASEPTDQGEGEDAPKLDEDDDQQSDGQDAAEE